MSAEFYLSIAAMLFGVAVVACVFRFGREIYDRSRMIEHCLEWILAESKQRGIRCSELMGGIEEYLERRNKFWELFGQVSLSVVVVVLLAGLMMMNKIEPDAGLPILSAIVAFVVGKGIDGPGRASFMGGRDPTKD